jgi:D-glycero-alpha-D-manno-heptose 1-phosphate guanylyltransferase
MTGLASITVAILAGGLGTRLRPAVADRPKVLAEVGGRPFLTYLLDRLIRAGGRRVVLCTGHLGEQISRRLGERYGSLRLAYSQEPTPLDTGGALRHALPLLVSDPVLVLNGDSICALDLAGLVARHRAGRSLLTLGLVRVAEGARYGQVVLDRAGRIAAFGEKARTGPGWVSAGVYAVGRRVLAGLPAGERVSLERELFPSLVGRGLAGYAGAAELLDIGTPESYARAEAVLAGWGEAARVALAG